MKDKLKKGQAFIGVDNQKYYFLGFDFNNQILFTNLDLWTDVEQRYLEKSKLFIKEVLNESSELIENCGWYYLSKEELNNSTMQDKVKRCLDIIDDSNTNHLEIVPVEIGPLVSGQAYSKEYNQYYEVIGFIIDIDVYLDNELKSSQKGFFGIYHSNCSEYAPLIFERSLTEKDNSFNGRHFIAGNDDVIDVENILLDKDVVNSYIGLSIKERLKNRDNGRIN